MYAYFHDGSVYCEAHAPKGADAVADGGGESDFPNHCDRCHCPLWNPLTSDGVKMVIHDLRSVLVSKVAAQAPSKYKKGTYYEGSPKFAILCDWAEQIEDYRLSDSDRGVVELFKMRHCQDGGMSGLGDFPQWRLKVWTGPTLVRKISEKAKKAGIEVETEGTENIYVIVEGTTGGAAEWNFIATMHQKHGTDFGLRPKAMREL
jgi:hypothetical protein